MAIISWFVLFLGCALFFIILIRLFKEEYFLPVALWLGIVFILAVLLHVMVQVYFGNISWSNYLQMWKETLFEFNRSEAYLKIKSMISNLTSNIR